MRGDHLSRQCRVVRTIEASPNGLTLAEIAKREDSGILTIYRDLEALQPAGSLLYTERVARAKCWAFIAKPKFKIPPPFTGSDLISLYSCKDLVRVLRGTFSHDSVHSLSKKNQSLFSPQALSNPDQIQSVFHFGIKPSKDYAQFRGNGYNGASL